mmetsp:Transcript_12695/g.30978  ORF Transcript_12695/g.30978 Transcript_12695/m.30978 type:complete len:90 (-) Transcript_12695:92-361(-)
MILHGACVTTVARIAVLAVCNSSNGSCTGTRSLFRQHSGIAMNYRLPCQRISDDHGDDARRESVGPRSQLPNLEPGNWWIGHDDDSYNK